MDKGEFPVSTVTLETMTEYDVEDLYDLWIDKDLWPAGDYFAAIPDLTALEDAIERKEIQLFKVVSGDGETLFGIVVNADPVHVDLFAALGDELTPEMGAATLTALIDWTFENTEATEILKYLDSQMSVIHNTFTGWGFTAVDEAVPATAEADAGAEEAATEEATANDAGPSEETADVSEVADASEASGEEPKGEGVVAEDAGPDAEGETPAAEGAEDTVDREPEDNEERTWSTYKLTKADYKGPLTA